MNNNNKKLIVKQLVEGQCIVVGCIFTWSRAHQVERTGRRGRLVHTIEFKSAQAIYSKKQTNKQTREIRQFEKSKLSRLFYFFVRKNFCCCF